MNRNSYDHRKNSYLNLDSDARPSRGAPRGDVGRSPRRPAKKRGMPIAVAIVIDVVAAALLLGLFYVTNYMVKTQVHPTTLPTPSASSISAATDSTASASPATTDTAGETTATINPGDWRAKFAEKFTDGEVNQTENSYQSANINISIDIQVLDGVHYYIADIYVADLQYFRTAFAKNADVMGDAELSDTVAQENNAILAITGDHCTDNQDTGVVIRNGNQYANNRPSSDQFVMYNDGTMKAYSPEDFNYDEVVAAGVYQVWSWGPMLLQNGQPMTEFNMPDQISDSNPRAAVGYIEPGHYYFLVVGGRLEDYSEGCTLEQLSQFMYGLGCVEAYNLDGGRSAEIVFMGNMLNQQDGRRSTPDILYIGENEG